MRTLQSWLAMVGAGLLATACASVATMSDPDHYVGMTREELRDALSSTSDSDAAAWGSDRDRLRIAMQFSDGGLGRPHIVFPTCYSTAGPQSEYDPVANERCRHDPVPGDRQGLYGRICDVDFLFDDTGRVAHVEIVEDGCRG